MLKIIPIKSIEELRQNSYTVEELLASLEESKKEELELEDR
jgi:hypothetical protein